MIGEDKLIRFSGVKSGEVRPQPLVVKSRSTLHAARSTLTPGLLFPAISCFPRLFPAVSDALLPHCLPRLCLPRRSLTQCYIIATATVTMTGGIASFLKQALGHVLVAAGATTTISTAVFVSTLANAERHARPATENPDRSRRWRCR